MYSSVYKHWVLWLQSDTMGRAFNIFSIKTIKLLVAMVALPYKQCYFLYPLRNVSTYFSKMVIPIRANIIMTVLNLNFELLQKVYFIWIGYISEAQNNS